jgi:hypothetical protein
LKIEYDSLHAKKSGGKKTARATLTGEDKEISLAGGRFSFVGELWVSGHILELDRPIGVDPLNPQRYAESGMGEMAMVAELYDSLPPKLQDMLASTKRRPTFKTIVSSFYSLHISFANDFL